MKKLFLISLALTFVLFNSLWSQDEDISEQTNNQEIEHESKYHAGIFLGATSNLEDKTTDFSIGLDYEYKLDMLEQTFGIGFIMEAVFAEHKESILGLPIFIHPGLGHLKFWLAPGVEFGDEPIASNETEDVPTEFKTNFLFRLGIGYDFHFDMFAVSPAISLDMIKGNIALVYGLTVGMSF